MLVLLAGFAVTASAFAGNWADPMFSELSKDFGSVPRGPLLKHTFTIQNNTGGQVRAVQLRTSCGCTVARMEESVLSPGQSTHIFAEMDSSRFLGDRTVTIYVTFDQPAATEVALSVHARSHEDVVVNPDTLDFGRGPRGVVRNVQTTVTFPGGQQWEIQKVVSDTSHVKATVAPETTEEGIHRYVLTAVLDDLLPAGNWHTELWLHTNHPYMDRIRIPVKAVVEPSLVVSPAQMNLVVPASSQRVHRKVMIRGATPFVITSIKGGNANWSVAEDKPGRSTQHILTITLEGPIQGPMERSFQVITDLPGDGNVQFQARAEGMK